MDGAQDSCIVFTTEEGSPKAQSLSLSGARPLATARERVEPFVFRPGGVGMLRTRHAGPKRGHQDQPHLLVLDSAGDQVEKGGARDVLGHPTLVRGRRTSGRSTEGTVSIPRRQRGQPLPSQNGTRVVQPTVGGASTPLGPPTTTMRERNQG